MRRSIAVKPSSRCASIAIVRASVSGSRQSSATRRASSGWRSRGHGLIEQAIAQVWAAAEIRHASVIGRAPAG